MKMKKLLKDFLAIGVAVSFVLNSAMGAAAEGMETTESGLDTVVESALTEDDADALKETEALQQETEELTETEAETAATEALQQEEKTEDVASDEPGVSELQRIQYEGTAAETTALGQAVTLKASYDGEVPEGKEFAGWTLDGNTVYAPGAMFTCSKELGQDMGTNPDGARGYLFDFKAYFKDVQEKTMGYIQFEGIDDYTEVELGRTVVLMSNYHGTVPEGKEFADWTLDGNTVYAPGAEFTFSKDLAVDMGTNEEGVHGYLFSFKARFADIEAPETEAPETEAPQTEAPQTEAPETEGPQTEEPETEEPQTEAPQTEEETEAPVKPAPGNDNGKNNDSAKKADDTGAVKTGDTTMIMPYVISLFAAAVVIAVVLLKRRRSAH